MAGIPIDGYLKVVAALISASFALIVLAAAPRKGPNRLLTAFLLLIAANQGFEALRSVAADEAARFFWFRLATVVAALDPFVLAWFVSLTPGGERLHRDPWVPVTLGIGGAFALTASFGLNGIPSEYSVYAILFRLFTFAVYGGLALHYLTRYGPTPRHLEVTALLIAALPVLGGVSEPLYYLLDAYAGFPQGITAIVTLDVGLVALCVAVVVWFMPRDVAPSARRRIMIGTGAAVGITALVLTFHFVRLIGPTVGVSDVLAYEVVGRAGAPFRWAAFSALFSIVLLRDDTFTSDVRTRRRAARLLITVALLTTAGLMVALLDAITDAQFNLPELALLLLVVLISQGFRGLVDRVASRVYGVPMPGDVGARYEAYRSAVESAVIAGRSLATDADLTRLRNELDIDPSTARVLEDIADSKVVVGLVPGATVARRYHIKAMLGVGTSARTFLATDTLLSRDVAIKEGFQDPHTAPRIEEARHAGAIEHPNVVSVYDVIIRGGAALLVSEYVPGGTLHDHLTRSGRLDHEAGERLVVGVLDGLCAVHARGIIHRDLKPGNILLGEGEMPKIADFGIATTRATVVEAKGGGGFVVGTRGFMAPEQEMGEQATPAVDVYAVGRLIRVAVQHPLPSAFECVTARALARDPAARCAGWTRRRCGAHSPLGRIRQTGPIEVEVRARQVGRRTLAGGTHDHPNPRPHHPHARRGRGRRGDRDHLYLGFDGDHGRHTSPRPIPCR